eukprot:3451720-Rhodomonas_salina.2
MELLSPVRFTACACQPTTELSSQHRVLQSTRPQNPTSHGRSAAVCRERDARCGRWDSSVACLGVYRKVCEIAKAKARTRFFFWRGKGCDAEHTFMRSQSQLQPPLEGGITLSPSWAPHSLAQRHTRRESVAKRTALRMRGTKGKHTAYG